MLNILLTTDPEYGIQCKRVINSPSRPYLYKEELPFWGIYSDFSFRLVTKYEIFILSNLQFFSGNVFPLFPVASGRMYLMYPASLSYVELS